MIGADAIVERIQDVKWQEAQRMIEDYGRECYERGLSEKAALPVVDNEERCT